ncbi:MAG: NADH-quinone oxidoreductase subunit N [Verrucomicrobiota bacterium]
MTLLPEIILTIAAVALILLDAFSKKSDIELIGKLAMFGVLLSFVTTFWYPPEVVGYGASLWQGLFALDPLAIFFKRFFLITLFIVLAMSFGPARRIRMGAAESFILPMFTAVGMMILASAVNLMLIFVGLELVTISFYVLVALKRHDRKCLEAGVKYLIVGALSTGFLVYGMAFVFGVAGTTSLESLSGYLNFDSPVEAGMLLAVILLIVGLGFKLASVPFQIWAPDVYQGAPTPVTAFLSVGSKAAGIVVVLRVFAFAGFGYSDVIPYVGSVFVVMAALSALLGNLAAIPQRNLKRLLGYSSIGHAGFLLMALSCIKSTQLGYTISDRGVQACLIYLVVYLLSALLAFYIISQHEEEIGGDDFKAYSGLAQRSPLLAFGMLVSFVSLAGIPPLAGFLGKFAIFAAIWEVGNIGLVIVAVLSALAGLYYYLGVVRSMYWSPATNENTAITVGGGGKLIIGILCVLIILLGVWHKPVEAMVSPVLSSEPLTESSY